MAVPGFETSPHFPDVIYYIRMCYIPVILAGTVTNIFNFIVLSHRDMRCLSTTVYLASLAISDLGVMYFELFRIWFERVELVKPELYFTDAYCKFANYTNGVTRDFSNWLIACLTAERLVVVIFPFEARSICTSKKAGTVTVALLLIICVLHTPDVVFATAQHYTWWVCWNDSSDMSRVLSSLLEFLVGYSVIIVVFVMNLVLVGVIYRKSLKRRLSVSTHGNHRLPAYEGRLTRTLLLVAFVFLVCETPRMILAFITSFEEKTELKRVILNASYILSGLNHACNFFIYICTSGRFRKVFVERFRRCCCACAKCNGKVRPVTPCDPLDCHTVM